LEAERQQQGESLIEANRERSLHAGNPCRSKTHDVRHLLRPQMLYMSSGEAVFFSRQEWQKISVDNDANHRDERSTAEAAWIFVPLRLTGDTG
jgi:hypothetical protein